MPTVEPVGLASCAIGSFIIGTSPGACAVEGSWLAVTPGRRSSDRLPHDCWIARSRMGGVIRRSSMPDSSPSRRTLVKTSMAGDLRPASPSSLQDTVRSAKILTDMTEEEKSHPAGLLSGFEAYLTVSASAIHSALSHGMVVLDTNVLLNLYRYGDSAKDDLLKVLEAIRDSLFIPHRVALEFWRRRENAMRDRAKMAELTASTLEDARDRSERAIRAWANRLAISDEIRQQLLDDLRITCELVLEEVVDASAGDGDHVKKGDTSEDLVLTRLTEILDGRVGPPMTPDDHAACVAEGHRRVVSKIPPGYKDKGKEGDDPAGDYLVWEQALREAKRRGDSAPTLVFVTGDTADDDWYRKEGGEIRGPRVELFDEALQKADTRLILLTPSSLIYHAQQALSLDIEADTVANIERSADISRLSDGGGWTEKSIVTFLHELSRVAEVQYFAVLAATENEGFVSRETVYEIGNYDKDRTLRGFTRPARRIMQRLQDEGLLADNVQDALMTVYDSEHSYVLASGFRVPDEFLAFLQGTTPAIGPGALEEDRPSDAAVEITE